METNKAISRRISAPLAGCAAHRFTFALGNLLVPQMPLIKNVSAFMKKMKTVKRVDKLKLHGCYYKPISLHELRWGGCYRMLKRFEDLQPYMHLVMDDCTAQDDASDDFTTYSNTENLQRIPLVDLITSPRDQRNIFALLN
ncbi:hypothetical protein GN958_ATG03297 [Phytophthora infestans]|uniref:Uncharacterized protein n=1 Tax=Phytophthora infestans TaxID=4787 RepID=A0A8S9V5Y7_PHYIN|nr:hypothetical protein GN958_ATG03297 [Phytophthora infestans]